MTNLVLITVDGVQVNKLPPPKIPLSEKTLLDFMVGDNLNESEKADFLNGTFNRGNFPMPEFSFRPLDEK